MSALIINNLNKRFNERYSKLFVELNKSVIKSLNENGGYDVYAAYLPDGGLVDVVGDESLPTITALRSEQNVVTVGTKTIKYKPIKTQYVIRIPWDQIEMTHNNVEYFNTYFDEVVQQAINNYIKKYGSAGTVRYGDSFMQYFTPKGDIFVDDGSGEHLDLYFTGQWASKEVV